MADLEKLVRNRGEILKAELAKWLHDWQKCQNSINLKSRSEVI